MCCLYYYILPPRRRSHPWATPERRGVITLLIADFRSSPRYAASYRPPSLCFSNRPPHDYERVFFFLSFFEKGLSLLLYFFRSRSTASFSVKDVCCLLLFLLFLLSSSRLLEIIIIHTEEARSSILFSFFFFFFFKIASAMHTSLL